MTYKLVCPHCHGKVRIRTSKGEHVFLRAAYLQCTNEACSWSAVARFEVTHDLTRSSMANPAALLPMAPSVLRREAMRSRADEAQMDLVDMLESGPPA